MTRVNLDFSTAQAVHVHTIWDEQDPVELHTLRNFFRNEIDLKNAESYELFEILKKALFCRLVEFFLDRPRHVENLQLQALDLRHFFFNLVLKSTGLRVPDTGPADFLVPSAGTLLVPSVLL